MPAAALHNLWAAEFWGLSLKPYWGCLWKHSAHSAMADCGFLFLFAEELLLLCCHPRTYLVDREPQTKHPWCCHFCSTHEFLQLMDVLKICHHSVWDPRGVSCLGRERSSSVLSWRRNFNCSNNAVTATALWDVDLTVLGVWHTNFTNT